MANSNLQFRNTGSSFPVNPVVTPNFRVTNDATLSELAPRIPWDRFTGGMFNPTPGQHIAIIGPTGQGKTVLQENIIPLFPFVAVFATKPADKNIDRLIDRHGYVRVASWLPLNPIDAPRRVVWPDARDIDADELQKQVFQSAIKKIFREGGRPKHDPIGWAIAIDELWYFTNVLNLKKEIKMLLLQGRSLGISLIGATQRPAWVPLEIYDQSTHLFFFRDNDSTNLDRAANLGLADKSVVRDIVRNLDEHQVLYVNTRTGRMARTRAPAPR